MFDLPPAPTQPPAGRILIVDDDASLCVELAAFLVVHGYAVDIAPDGAAMTQALGRGLVDLIILDVRLPGDDGLDLCRRLTGPAAPGIILLSASAEATDRIIGIELGADDYLAKPCHPRELLARIRAVLRRRRAAPVTEGFGACYDFAGWSLNLVRRELHAPDQTLICLSSGEFALLTTLLHNPNTVLTRDELLDLAHGRDSEFYDRAIDVQISRLRRKLGLSGASELIRTIRGEGYMLTAKVYRREWSPTP